MTTTRAAIYARFSSDKQHDKSIDDQVALCRRVAEREGMRIVATYDDRAISGASVHNRLGLQRLMRDAKAGKFDVLISEALDRISRDQEDLAGIHKRLRHAGVEIVTAADGATSEIHVGVKGLLGALYLKDLADKTRRGQAGVIREGRHNGGRSYGYQPIPGRPGELEIVKAEAAIVRRIAKAYVAGESARTIAISLNEDQVAGPRGCVWNASTIHGSASRRNGILQNELYAGVIVWNRQRFVKDPDTGKRISRENPKSEWMRAEAEHLRIIEAETWQAVRDRFDGRAKLGKRLKQRHKHLLSGLTVCGCCGSGYVAAAADKRGILLRCSRNRETGLCSNRQFVPRKEIEQGVIDAIDRNKLAAPEIVAEYIREYHRVRRELNSHRSGRQRDIDKRLNTVAAAIKQAADVLTYGTPSRTMAARLADLEVEQDRLLLKRQEIAPDTVEFHPKAADQYLAMVRDLKKTLSEMSDSGSEIVHEK
jgi:site-specific DNA recombinase